MEEEKDIDEHFEKTPEGMVKQPGVGTIVSTPSDSKTVVAFGHSSKATLRPYRPQQKHWEGRELRSLVFLHSGDFPTVGIRMNPSAYGETQDREMHVRSKDELIIHIPVEDFPLFVQTCQHVLVQLGKHKLSGKTFDKVMHPAPDLVDDWFATAHEQRQRSATKAAEITKQLQNTSPFKGNLPDTLADLFPKTHHQATQNAHDKDQKEKP